MRLSLQCGGARVLCEHHSLIVFLRTLATHEREQNKYEEKYFSLITVRTNSNTVVFTNHISFLCGSWEKPVLQTSDLESSKMRRNKKGRLKEMERREVTPT
jgi:hypothetical protein